MDIEVFIELRKAKNLSQSELCEGICTQTTLSRFENQGKVPTLKILIQLCNRLGLSLDKLFPKVGLSYSDSDKKMEKIEFLLILREYEKATKILNQINVELIDNEDGLARYYYLRGFCSIFNDEVNTDTLFIFDQLLLLEGIKDIYKLLAYTGIGITYVNTGEYVKAEGYFSKAIENIFTYQIETTEDNWRILHIVYNCGVFYSEIEELETSDSLLNYAIKICSDNHVTYYVARVSATLAKNAIKRGEDITIIKEYLQDARSFAKFNGNKILINELNKLTKYYE